jgi:hypothetical protein
MKKLFFRRHRLFFISLGLLAICEIILAKRCIQHWHRGIILSEEISAMNDILADKTKTLPNFHIQEEQIANIDIQKYRNFVADTWLNIARRERENETRVQPSTNVALFFEISDFVAQSRESCDSLGISYDQDYSFGFKEYLNQKEQPLNSEIQTIHQQKDQIKTILKHLFESRTTYLRIVDIERGTDKISTNYNLGDTFVSRGTRIQSEDIQSNVYRFTFESFTGTFRKFLNSLRDSEIPFILRKIEIESCKQTHLNRQVQERVLEGVPSRYIVTVEMLNLPNDLTRRYRRDARYLRRLAL